MSVQTVRKRGARTQQNCAVPALVGDFRSVRGDPANLQPISSSYLDAAARDRACSQGLVGPGFGQGGAFISPHAVEYNTKNTAFISKPVMEQSQPVEAFSRTEKEVHQLNTEMHRNYLSSSEENLIEGSSSSQRQHQGEHSCSSPEMYLVCTSKERSETSYSSESQGSVGGLNEAEHVSHSSSSISASSPIAVESHWSSKWGNGDRSKVCGAFSLDEEALRIGGSICNNQDEYDREPDINQVAILSTSVDAPRKIGKTKPIPPPKRRGSDDQNAAFSPDSTTYSCSVSPPSSSSGHPSPQCSGHPSPQRSGHPSPQHSGHPSPQRSQTQPLFPSTSLSSRRYTGELLASQRLKATSFLDCKAGEESGRFSVDYLGSKEIDKYIKSINSITKQLMAEQRPREMVVYVSSEKIRLAPPNSATLYQSFAVKDVMWVRKCGKNKHVIGIVMWKSVAMRPTCHILRCRDNIMAKNLFDILWEQTQKVDVISSAQENRSSFELRPLSINSMSSEEGSVAPTPPTSVTEILHRFPALYIGSTALVKSNSNIDDVIGKVLGECKPSEARSVTMALSLSEVQMLSKKLETSSSDRDEKFLLHETSRVRLMGVYSEDRRFSGYVIKEMGKPLEGHVIRCNSAALMTSFTSFLRQSCQLTSAQRGGSFYDELSTDESDEWDCPAERHSSSVTASGGFVNRIKSLTCSIAQLSSSQTSPLTSSLSMPHPTFQSHLHQPSSTMQSLPPCSTQALHSTMDSSGPIQSPFDFSDEEYAKFRVTYLGSATQDYRLSQHSVGDALYQFSKDGMSGGQAAITKNTVSLQVSSLGINLTDKSKKLFVNRNYPLKTIIGFCQHYSDNKHFAFATERPGFPNLKKVHVFCCLEESPVQVLAAMKYWLQMEPIVSGPIHSFQNSEQS